MHFFLNKIRGKAATARALFTGKLANFKRNERKKNTFPQLAEGLTREEKIFWLLFRLFLRTRVEIKRTGSL